MNRIKGLIVGHVKGEFGIYRSFFFHLLVPLVVLMLIVALQAGPALWESQSAGENAGKGAEHLVLWAKFVVILCYVQAAWGIFGSAASCFKALKTENATLQVRAPSVVILALVAGIAWFWVHTAFVEGMVYDLIFK